MLVHHYLLSNNQSCIDMVGVIWKPVFKKDVQKTNFLFGFPLWQFFCTWVPEVWKFSSELQVAQYASDAGNGNAAFNNVDQCLRYLPKSLCCSWKWKIVIGVSHIVLSGFLSAPCTLAFLIVDHSRITVLI